MRWIVVVAVLVASSGCGWSSEAEKWRRTAEDHQSQLATANNALDQTRKELQEQTEKWQNQSQKLNAAMIDASSKLDPFEIRKIYLDNRDLAAVADQLEAKIASAIPADGDLVLTDAQLRFDVTGYQGRSVIRAYLDYDTAPILVSELAATERVLALRYNIASEFYGEILTANRAHASESVTSLFPVNDRANEEMAAKLADGEFRARRSEIDTRYENAVTSEFLAYLKRGSSGGPQVLPKPVFLAGQVRTPGRHELRIEIDPKTPDWEVRLAATEVAKEKNDRVVRYWQLNGHTTPDPKSIPRMVFWIRYGAGDRK